MEGEGDGGWGGGGANFEHPSSYEKVGWGKVEVNTGGGGVLPGAGSAEKEARGDQGSSGRGRGRCIYFWT